MFVAFPSYSSLLFPVLLIIFGFALPGVGDVKVDLHLPSDTGQSRCSDTTHTHSHSNGCSSSYFHTSTSTTSHTDPTTTPNPNLHTLPLNPASYTNTSYSRHNVAPRPTSFRPRILPPSSELPQSPFPAPSDAHYGLEHLLGVGVVFAVEGG